MDEIKKAGKICRGGVIVVTDEAKANTNLFVGDNNAS